MNIPLFSSRWRRAQSFTLVEMLVVIMLIVILASLSLIAFQSITSSTALSTSTQLVNTAFSYARQDAIAKNCLASVVIITDPTTPNAYSTFAIWDYTNNPSATAGAWEQVTTWKTLPPGIVFDNGTNAYTSSKLYYLSTNQISLGPLTNSSYITTSNSATPALSSIKYLGGTKTSGYAYQTFLPSGRLYSTSTTSYSLLLDEGIYNTSGSLTYTHINTNSGPANFAWFFLNPANGTAKILRP